MVGSTSASTTPSAETKKYDAGAILKAAAALEFGKDTSDTQYSNSELDVSEFDSGDDDDDGNDGRDAGKKQSLRTSKYCATAILQAAATSELDLQRTSMAVAGRNKNSTHKGPPSRPEKDNIKPSFKCLEMARSTSFKETKRESSAGRELIKTESFRHIRKSAGLSLDQSLMEGLSLEKNGPTSSYFQSKHSEDEMVGKRISRGGGERGPVVDRERRKSLSPSRKSPSSGRHGRSPTRVVALKDDLSAMTRSHSGGELDKLKQSSRRGMDGSSASHGRRKHRSTCSTAHGDDEGGHRSTPRKAASPDDLSDDDKDDDGGGRSRRRSPRTIKSSLSIGDGGKSRPRRSRSCNPVPTAEGDEGNNHNNRPRKSRGSAVSGDDDGRSRRRSPRTSKSSLPIGDDGVTSRPRRARSCNPVQRAEGDEGNNHNNRPRKSRGSADSGDDDGGRSCRRSPRTSKSFGTTGGDGGTSRPRRARSCNRVPTSEGGDGDDDDDDDEGHRNDRSQRSAMSASERMRCRNTGRDNDNPESAQSRRSGRGYRGRVRGTGGRRGGNLHHGQLARVIVENDHRPKVDPDELLARRISDRRQQDNDKDASVTNNDENSIPMTKTNSGNMLIGFGKTAVETAAKTGLNAAFTAVGTLSSVTEYATQTALRLSKDVIHGEGALQMMMDGVAPGHNLAKLLEDTEAGCIETVTDSWKLVQRTRNYQKVAGGILFTHLFKHCTPAKALFGFPADADPESEEVRNSLAFVTHSTYLIQMIEKALTMLTEMGPASKELPIILYDLGKKHSRMGVEESYFPIMGTALIETIREILGTKRFTSYMETSWELVYDVLADEICHGMNADKIVLMTWAKLKRIPDYRSKAGLLLFTHMFLNCPESQTVFGFALDFTPDEASLQESSRFRMHSEYLIMMFEKALEMVEAKNVDENMKYLGEKHVQYGVKIEYFPFMGEALFHTLEVMLKKDFNDETREAWLSAYGRLSSQIISAMRSSEK